MIDIQSLNQRTLYKILTNLVNLFFSFGIAMIVPRVLGPYSYGNFEFITSVFRELIPFFTLGTGYCYYVKISQRQNELELIGFYRNFLMLILIIMSLAITLSFNDAIYNIFWFEQNKTNIVMGLIFCSTLVINEFLFQTCDAHGLTKSLEKAKMFQKFVGFFIILIVAFSNYLNLSFFFIFNIIINVFLFFIVNWILIKNKIQIFQNTNFSKSRTLEYFKEFYEYSAPLFTYTLAGVIFAVFDRLILQNYSGSIEQGYFGLSNRIGSICIIFTSAVVLLLTREISIAFKDNDLKTIRKLFRKYIPILYSISAIVSCFVFVNSKEITSMFGGVEYKGALGSVMLMSLYPIHQTYGQLFNGVLYATSKTKIIRNIGIIFMFFGGIISFFLIAPKSVFGLNYGSAGLVIKMLVVQIISVNFQLYYICKLIKISFYKYFFHQFFCLAIIFGIAFFSKICLGFFLQLNNIYGEIIMSFTIYSFLLLAAIIAFPIVFGIYRKDIDFLFSLIRDRF